MAKLGKVSEETQRLVDEIVTNSGLDMYMNVVCLSITKQKNVVKVARANATTEYFGNCPDTVIIYVLENVFERLSDEGKRLVLEDAISTIYFDTEKDKIIITPPEINVTISGRKKYGDKLLDVLEQCVLIAEQIAEEEQERKAMEKENKKKK